MICLGQGGLRSPSASSFFLSFAQIQFRRLYCWDIPKWSLYPLPLDREQNNSCTMLQSIKSWRTSLYRDCVIPRVSTWLFNHVTHTDTLVGWNSCVTWCTLVEVWQKNYVPPTYSKFTTWPGFKPMNSESWRTFHAIEMP